MKLSHTEDSEAMPSLFLWRGKEGALEEFGLDEYARRADIVLGPLRPESRGVYEYADLDPADLAFIACAELIKKAWEEEFPEDAHLGHAAFGKWCWYWFTPDLRSVWDLLRENDADELRTQARHYIDSRFGLGRGPKVVEVEHTPAAFLEASA